MSSGPEHFQGQDPLPRAAYAEELANFPAILKQLIEDELAAGNQIVEVGHSFPAPPVGAYFKLSRKVSTRPRASEGELDFYDRNNSHYSGQFTDSKRFFFVLEPPESPPEEMDMDAIRRGLNAANNYSNNNSSISHASGSTMDVPTSDGPSLPIAARPAEVATSSDLLRSAIIAPTAEGAKPFLKSSTSTGQSWLVFITSAQPLYAVKEELERKCSAIFHASDEGSQSTWVIRTQVPGVHYALKLTLLSASRALSSLAIAIEADWSHVSKANEDYCKNSSAAWVDMWTNGFCRHVEPPLVPNDVEYYAECVAEAQEREAGESTVEDIQQTLLSLFKQGAIASNSHKEGGTHLSWTGTHFLRVDYGDYPDKQVYQSDAEFLKALFQFYSPSLTELDSWKLILRKVGNANTQS